MLRSLPPSPPKTEESSRLRHPMKDEDWHAAAALVRQALANFDPERVRCAVDAIVECIARLDGLMDRFCALTCPSCQDPCCHGGKVFFNLADLITLTARDKPIPPGQTRTASGLPCRYLGPRGCALDRFSRPYVCVWFLCEPQMELLNQEPLRVQRDVIHMLQTIRTQRLWLETFYENHEDEK